MMIILREYIPFHTSPIIFIYFNDNDNNHHYKFIVKKREEKGFTHSMIGLHNNAAVK